MNERDERDIIARALRMLRKAGRAGDQTATALIAGWRATAQLYDAFKRADRRAG